MKNINKSELINAMKDSANGGGAVFIIERNTEDIEIWVNTASKDAIQMGGVDVLWSKNFTGWHTTDEDLDETDIDYNFDNTDIEEELEEIGIELI